MNLQEIIEGLVNSESNEGCSNGFSVVQKKWVRKLEDYLENMKQEEKEAKGKEELLLLRLKVAENKFDEADNSLFDIPEESEVVDSESWECDGDNKLFRVFYYNPPLADDLSSSKGTFYVEFKDGTPEVIDVHSNT